MSSNEQRAERAYRALLAYADSEEDIKDGTAMGDLLADMLHLGQQYNLTPTEIVDRGVQHYGCDVVDEKWVDDDRFTAIQQDAANEPLVREILAEADVPDNQVYGCLRKLGMRT